MDPPRCHLEKSRDGRSAVTFIDKAPALHAAVAAGVPAFQIPEAEQMEAEHRVWNAQAQDVMNVGPVEARTWSAPEEVVRFLVCPRCGKLVAEP